MGKATSIIPAERVERAILIIRGERVMLSTDLAGLYGVEPRALMQAVRRNLARFPTDFMFQLSRAEHANLKSQTVISRWGGARRSRPYAFTEHGIAMLSSVLRSERAIMVNIAVVRAFVALRRILSTHSELARKLEQLERRLATHDRQIRSIFEAIRELMEPPPEPKPLRIGFHTVTRRRRSTQKGR